ncbi:MAG: carboxypeptidase regulatory-like domain-containing protein [Muribaculaceae bacterium]|nr:carboxypeptidase regulatory-like domain-containing protein [Muribaculaceae bacterium]
MKKIILLSAMAVAAAMTVNAKTADELRIYINPGHGGWTPNDRPCNLVNHPGPYSRTNTDTCSFFESNTDLEKGFAVLERLIQYGVPFDRTKNQDNPDPANVGAARDLEQNIVMSRVKNGPYHDDNGTENQLGSSTPEDIYAFNRNLSEICEEVQANNFDMFISIHSNANQDGDGVNYPLYLYRGYDTPKEETGVTLDHQTLSRAMADACWGYGIANPHAYWSSYKTSKNLRGDINFYNDSSTSTRSDGTPCKGYLGVLKHTAPGFLVEGYFHTYQPARHRAMNWDVCRVEGNAYARGIADYFGLTKESTGTIYGIVRDLHEKFTDQWYKPAPTSDDIYKPINGATVTLKKGNDVVATYTTDENYNGAFVFDGVEPGEYTIVVTHPDYKELDNIQTVTVKAAADTYPKFALEAVGYEPPKEIFETYPDPAATISGMAPASEYTFATDYEVEIPALEGKIVRRTVIRKGLMYILAIDRLPELAQVPEHKPVPTVLVYDLANKAVVAEVSTEGTYGTIQDVADIQVTDDGYLLATCQTKNQYDNSYLEDLPDGTKEPRGTLYVYKWGNDENGLPTGKPEQWLSHNGTGRWYRSYVGGTFAYTGTSVDGLLLVSQPTITAPYYTLRTTSIVVANGVQASAGDYTTPNNICEIAGGTNPGFGEGYRMVVSPFNTNNVMFVGPDYQAEFPMAVSDGLAPNCLGNEVMALTPGAVSAFKFAGASYLVVPDVEEGQLTGVKLIDLSENINKAKVVSTSNTSIEGTEFASIATAGETGTSYDKVNEVYTDAWLNLYVLCDNKLTKFTTHNVAQPVYKAGMVYNVETRLSEGGDLVFNYEVTADGQEAELVLTPAEGEALTYALEATTGEHTFTVPATDIEADATYDFAINFTTKGSPAAGEIFSENNGLTGRGGVVTITDPKQASYGFTVVLNSFNNGVDIYNPAGVKVGDKVWKQHELWQVNTTNQSNPFRGHERNGKVIAAAWGDAACGLVVVDPLQKEEPYSLYAGEITASGAYMYNGVNVGGGVSGVCVVGEGENQKVFTFSEDHAGTTNTIVRYDLGNEELITEAPVELGYASLLANTNVDLLGYGEGFWAAQVRGAGNNIDANPSFTYFEMDAEGNVTPVMKSSNVDGIDNNVGAIAITTDGKTLACPLAGSIAVLDVEWDGNTPKATLAYSIPTATESWAHARFDAAGNLHIYSRSNGGYHVYGLRDAGHVVSFTGSVNTSETGVNGIVTDVTEGTPVFYNLNGVLVSGENMVPGVYVKVVNGKATKVVVK